ncbi:MAG: ribosome small subunit-dependent GTPase A [Lachnospiraceae bacterium]|nr:ribosome small subunit-dependent GTPase A [Lachnospiraceae bacterium]
MPYGKIVKSLSGFYEVQTETERYRCRAAGVFRAQGIKPLVGDNVDIDIVDEVSCPKEGSVRKIGPRRNELIRPNVANVDQAMMIFSIRDPEPSFQMIDRFLLETMQRNLPAILVFSKADLSTEEDRRKILSIYEKTGCPILFMKNDIGETAASNGRGSVDSNGGDHSAPPFVVPENVGDESDGKAKTESSENSASVCGLGDIYKVLRGKTTVFAGPSGVGKSTLINRLCPDANMETGELSRRIARGKNTTRHVELFRVPAPGEAGQDGSSMTFVMDTPGFTSLNLFGMEAEDLKQYYPEFDEYLGLCRFDGCNHMEEPGCAVKRAVDEGTISRVRYENYRTFYKELQDQKKY